MRKYENRNVGLDVLRIILAFLVVGIHVMPQQQGQLHVM